MAYKLTAPNGDPIYIKNWDAFSAADHVTSDIMVTRVVAGGQVFFVKETIAELVEKFGLQTVD